MDFQFKGEANDEGICDSDSENEYQLEITIDTMTLTKFQPDDIQLIFLFGDLVNKMTTEKGEGFDGRKQIYTLHSVPSGLSEKLLNLPIMLYAVTLVDLKPLGEFRKAFHNAAFH